MDERLYISNIITRDFAFTEGIEGPACDRKGNLYAVNYMQQHTIGKVTPEGESRVFLTLPGESTGNGIRFNSRGDMLIADYVNHNIFKVDMKTCDISVYAHEPNMNQPNDIAIGSDDIIYASDPNWSESTGQLWRIDTDGKIICLEQNMGTTNGIEVSPDEKTLYVNESVQRRIWAYDIVPGGISNKRLFVQFDDFGLDGMRCDTRGNLYVTRYGKGTVVKISPVGEILLEVELYGKNCTNVAFGGPDGCTCHVTVADRGHVEVFRTEFPGREWMLATR